MKRINLIPQAASNTHRIGAFHATFSGDIFSKVILGLFVFLVFFFVWHSTAIVRYRIHIADQKEDLQQLQRKLKETSNAYAQIQNQKTVVQNQKKKLQDKLAFWQKVQGGHIRWSGVLEQLSALVPKDVIITKAKFNRDMITLAGRTSENSIVGDFMFSLDRSDYFQNTSFNYMQKVTLADEAVIDFEITTRLDEHKVAR